MPVRELQINNGQNLVWVDMENPTQQEVQNMADRYQINSHLIADLVDPSHLPKKETLDEYTFLILRFVSEDIRAHVGDIRDLTTKITVFFHDDFLITIRLSGNAFLAEIWKEMQEKQEEISSAHLLVEIVRKSLATFEESALVLDEQLEEYEATVLLKAPKPPLIRGLYFIKRKASACRKTILLSDEPIQFLKTTQAHKSAVQDVQDLYVKLVLLYDQILDDAHNLLNVYLSLSAQKTNDVIKVLTIFSVFFMPLTFIAGIYGMNFVYMPEVEQKWGYPVTIGVMVAITLIIYIWFRSKKWL